jgi:hypothetical protein
MHRRSCYPKSFKAHIVQEYLRPGARLTSDETRHQRHPQSETAEEALIEVLRTNDMINALFLLGALGLRHEFSNLYHFSSTSTGDETQLGLEMAARQNKNQ